jgi:hypothetical protein
MEWVFWTMFPLLMLMGAAILWRASLVADAVNPPLMDEPTYRSTRWTFDMEGREGRIAMTRFVGGGALVLGLGGLLIMTLH